MPFAIATLNQTLLLDNPTYERYVRSDLHALVTMLRQVPALWTAASVAAEMKRIAAVKWVKYARTRRYLETEIPGLTNALRATPVGFRTISMTSQMDSTILSHRFEWASDTGNLLDLQIAYTRERVTWPQWPAGLVACIGLPHGAAYTVAGVHSGLAANPANTGRGTDDHALLGPFNQAILNYNGAPLRAQMDQVYEYSYDRVNWLQIPGSNYTIVREVIALPGGRVQLSITKTSVTRPNDRFVVRKVF